jgi:hypothetical protein
MSYKIIIIYLLTFMISVGCAQENKNLKRFDTFFIDKTMRIDYFHIGDAKSEIFTIDHLYQYGVWAGSRINLIDGFNNGRYYAKIYDVKSKELIYSKGYDCFFGEYKSGSEAIAGIKRTFHESILIPYPKSKIKLVIEKRDDKNLLVEVFSVQIDPQDISIIRKDFTDKSINIYKPHIPGDVHGALDIAILAEGYTTAEKDKFESDLERFKNVMLAQEPYRSMSDHINIYGVFKPSLESGVDEPRAGIFRNTSLSATFNSLGSERYLMTEDNKAMRDIGASVPYDALYIMVNHERYGGGGIYNLFCTFTSDNQWHAYLFLHEFGHSFAGLADEYYTSDVAYNDFYPKGIEPVEPNITRLLAPDNIKWKNLTTKNTMIPTPWEKADYDTMDLAWQKRRRAMNNRIAELKRTKSSTDAIQKAEQEYVQKDRAHAIKVDNYLKSSKYFGQVGAFEGAGYSAQGIYRPMIDCIMFSKGDKPFCSVCETAVKNVIGHYLE